jgi:hypothetical protein
MNINNYSGLAVLSLRIPDGDHQPRSDFWRLELKDSSKHLADAQPLHIYVESTPRNKRNYWVIGDEYAFVAKNVDYLPPLKNYADPQCWDSEGVWSYDWDDYAAALLVVLPPGVGASDGFPPPRAIVKREDNGQERLLLWFTRPPGTKDLDNWITRWKVYEIEQGTRLTSVAASLNSANRKHREVASSTRTPAVIDSGGEGTESPTYWWASAALACIGLFIGAAAVPSAALRTALEAVAAVLIVGAIIGFAYARARRRRSTE